MEGNLIPGLSKRAGLEFYESPPTQVLGSLTLFQVFLNSFFPFFAKPSKDAKIGALPEPVEGLTSTTWQCRPLGTPAATATSTESPEHRGNWESLGALLSD